MRYFKRIENAIKGLYKINKIYPETFKKNPYMSVVESNREYPERWQEVSEIDYIKQQGWYIRGSEEFRNWVEKHGFDLNGCYGNWSGYEYTIIDGKVDIVNNSCYKVDQTREIEVTIDQLNEIYNIKSKDKQMGFKIGDTVRIDQKEEYSCNETGAVGVITEFHNNGIHVRVQVEGKQPQYSNYERLKWISKVNTKQKEQMENFQVEVNETTSKILQKLAFENGWSWRAGATEVKWTNSKILAFESNSKDVSMGHLIGTKTVSLEEAIERITTKEESFKEGDWVKDSLQRVFKLTRLSFGSWEGVLPNGNTYSEAKKAVRKATDKEVESALIAEAKRRGFKEGVCINNTNLGWGISKARIGTDSISYQPDKDRLFASTLFIYEKGKWAEIIDEPKEIFGYEVTKLDDNTFEFGCEDHVYTRDELSRIVDTLGEIKGRHTVQQLFSELCEIVDS